MKGIVVGKTTSVELKTKRGGVTVYFRKYQGLHPRIGKCRTVTECCFDVRDQFALACSYRNPADKSDDRIGKAVAFKKAVDGLPRATRGRLLHAFFSDDKTDAGYVPRAAVAAKKQPKGGR